MVADYREQYSFGHLYLYTNAGAMCLAGYIYTGNNAECNACVCCAAGYLQRQHCACIAGNFSGRNHRHMVAGYCKQYGYRYLYLYADGGAMCAFYHNNADSYAECNTILRTIANNLQR